MLCALLRNAVTRKEPGVNVLLYGPPGTGKTELAKVVAQAAGLELFEVEYADRDGNSLSGRDRYRSLQIAQVFLKGSAQAALLFDEVEDVFPPISSEAAQLMARAEQVVAPPNSSVSGKAWVNQILESNAVPTIWVTNRIEQIDPAFRRRFAYHLELKSPPPGAREGLVRKTLEGVTVSDAFVGKLTERKGLTPAQIRTAVRFAGLASADGSSMESLIERQLRNSDQALGNRAHDTGARRSVTTYDLDMLNVETRFELPRIVAALKARGHGTLCFYGAPGTGKTALAEHIAKSLDKPLLIKQASDLMSKFVGETEQNMAGMFREAENEKAVLLLDEADSFLQDRRGAQRTYEVTEVNEMLQGMERFNGIFVCTTNLMDRIDQAALRRFTFKIRFKPLTAVQREKMFVTEALAGDAALLTDEAQARLAQARPAVPRRLRGRQAPGRHPRRRSSPPPSSWSSSKPSTASSPRCARRAASASCSSHALSARRRTTRSTSSPVGFQLLRADPADALQVAQRARRQRGDRGQRRVVEDHVGRQVVRARHLGAPRLQRGETRLARVGQAGRHGRRRRFRRALAPPATRPAARPTRAAAPPSRP